MSRQEYIDKNVDLHMKDEGNAQFNAAKVRDEIGKNGGPNTGIPGQHEQEYQDAYDRHKAGTLTEDQAKQEMAKTMERETVSGQQNQNVPYRDYYGDFYGKHYNRYPPPP
ncbi:MAG: hypothetical protein QM784_31850 [Polyangiaceae bacterium]